jgi:hypothetical protein
VRSAGHILHSGSSRARNIDTLFFMLGWDLCGFHKKRGRTRYAELVFLHLTRSTGHVVHFGAQGARNVDALFLCSGRTGTDSIKSAVRHVTPNLCFCIRCDLRVTLCILVRPGHETSTHNFSCSGGPHTDSTKSTPGHVTPKVCFCVPWDRRFT